MSLTVRIPGWKSCDWEHLVLDLNGTLALDGELLPGVQARIAELSSQLMIHLVTADTHGCAVNVAAQLEIALQRLNPGDEAQQKAEFVRGLGAAKVVAIGNGRNDAAMLTRASLGIAVLGPEGTACATLGVADVMVTDILDAFDLFLYPQRLQATLRA